MTAVEPSLSRPASNPRRGGSKDAAFAPVRILSEITRWFRARVALFDPNKGRFKAPRDLNSRPAPKNGDR
jgi:hypothetical protein